jgi:hypothetical protein
MVPFMKRRNEDEPIDEVVAAHEAIEVLIGGKLTEGTLRTPATEVAAKDRAATTFGRLGASKGGKARAAKLSNRKRKEIARKAATARWGK